MGNKFKRAKEIAMSILSPMGQSASAEDLMEKRKKKLEKLGPKKSGGMFDVIYKGRKTREDELNSGDY